MRPKPCNGTHWLMSPNDAKCSRSIDRMTGSKNDLGSEVTARVLVGTDAGGEGGGEDSSSTGDSDLAMLVWWSLWASETWWRRTKPLFAF